MALEWKEAKDGAALPSELLERLTQSLFLDQGSTTSARHPAEDVLAALLGASASAKVAFPGGEVQFDRRSLQRARSAASAVE